MTVLGAIDIGSNAMRLVIGSVGRNHELNIVDNYREPVRLGHDVFSSGLISEETSHRAIAALAKFRDIAKSRKVEVLRAVATSALREARNRQFFIDRAAEEADLHIQIIDGAEEARLVYLAVSHKVDLSEGVSLLVDIGGGSIELTLVVKGNLVFSESVKMGTVRLLHLLGEGRVGQKTFTRLVEKYVESIRKRLNSELEERSVDRCIGTGGNLDAFAALLEAKTDQRGVRAVTSKELQTLVKELEEAPIEERIRRFNLKPDRADVIVPAGIVLTEILRHARVKEIMVPGVGLKDGILYDVLPESRTDREELHRKQVLDFARGLGEKYHYDAAHAERVAAFATSIFDQSSELHGLDEEARLLLEVGSWLHDIGQFISVNGHHKHGQYVINSSPLVGLSDSQRRIVGCLVRYHRKSAPKTEHADFGGLPARSRDSVRKLAAILRLAEALDRERASRIEKLVLQCGKKEVALEIKGQGDFILERWAVGRNAGLFEDVFARKLILTE